MKNIVTAFGASAVWLLCGLSSVSMADDKIPTDLNVHGCIRAQDIPRLFPKDSSAQLFRARRDPSLCENLPSGISRIREIDFRDVSYRATGTESLEYEGRSLVRFMVSVQLVDGKNGGGPLAKEAFEIRTEDGSSQNVTTDQNGRTQFEDAVSYTPAEKMRLIAKFAWIINKNTGKSRRLISVVSPWESGSFRFGSRIENLSRKSIAEINLKGSQR